MRTTRCPVPTAVRPSTKTPNAVRIAKITCPARTHRRANRDGSWRVRSSASSSWYCGCGADSEYSSDKLVFGVPTFPGAEAWVESDCRADLNKASQHSTWRDLNKGLRPLRKAVWRTGAGCANYPGYFGREDR